MKIAILTISSTSVNTERRISPRILNCFVTDSNGQHEPLPVIMDQYP